MSAYIDLLILSKILSMRLVHFRPIISLQILGVQDKNSYFMPFGIHSGSLGYLTMQKDVTTISLISMVFFYKLMQLKEKRIFFTKNKNHLCKGKIRRKKKNQSPPKYMFNNKITSTKTCLPLWVLC